MVKIGEHWPAESRHRHFVIRGGGRGGSSTISIPARKTAQVLVQSEATTEPPTPYPSLLLGACCHYLEAFGCLLSGGNVKVTVPPPIQKGGAAANTLQLHGAYPQHMPLVHVSASSRWPPTGATTAEIATLQATRLQDMGKTWPDAGQQGAPHMHVLVCICSNVRQFDFIHPYPAKWSQLYVIVCRTWAKQYLLGSGDHD